LLPQYSDMAYLLTIDALVKASIELIMKKTMPTTATFKAVGPAGFGLNTERLG